MREKHYQSKRVMAGILSALMCLSMLPQTAYAVESTDTAIVVENETAALAESVTATEKETEVETTKAVENDAQVSEEAITEEAISEDTTAELLPEEILTEESSEETEEELELEAISGKCGDNLSYYITGTNDSRILVITGYGPMYDYAEGGAPWYTCNRCIKK